MRKSLEQLEDIVDGLLEQVGNKKGLSKKDKEKLVEEVVEQATPQITEQVMTNVNEAIAPILEAQNQPETEVKDVTEVEDEKAE